MPQNPTLEEWRLLTLRLRIAGWSYREIATRVGCSRRRSSATSGVCATGCERTSTRPRSSRWNCKIASRRRSPCISAVPPAERKRMPMARDRVIELRRVRAGDLRPDPRNWRRHPPGQRAVLSPDARIPVLVRRPGPLGGGSGDGHPRPPRDHGRGGPRRPRPAALRFRCASAHRPQGDVRARSNSANAGSLTDGFKGIVRAGRLWARTRRVGSRSRIRCSVRLHRKCVLPVSHSPRPHPSQVPRN